MRLVVRSGSPFLLAAALLAAACGGDPGSGAAPSPATPPPTVAPPEVAVQYPPLLVVVGDPWEVDLALGFSGVVTRWEVSSSDPTVASVAVSSATLTVTPHQTGTSLLTVAAHNSGGSGTQLFSVDVREPFQPAARGDIEPMALLTGGEPAEVEVDDRLFRPRLGLRIEASSQDERVVNVALDPNPWPDTNTLRITPVGVGETVVVLTGSTPIGFARHEIRVAVFDGIQIRLHSPLVRTTGAPITLYEGGGFAAEVQVTGAEPPGQGDGFWLGIQSDAPPDRLRTPESVVPRLPVALERGLATFPIEAPVTEASGGADRIYTVRLVPPPGGLPPRVVLDPDVLRVRVVDTPLASCDTSFTGRVTGLEYYTEGEIGFAASHPATTVRIVEPYGPIILADRVSQTKVLPRSLSFSGDTEEFRAGFSFWWLNSLILEAEVPGCVPRAVVCGKTACSVR